MKPLLFVTVLLMSGCGASAVRAPATTAVPPPCGPATDSTLAFGPSATALSGFLSASLAEFAGRVPADRLTFPVDSLMCGIGRTNILDLLDTTNVYTVTGESVYIAPGHAYHVYAVTNAVSFSHIAFFEPDTTVVFSSVNCTDRGDTIDDAVAYLRRVHPERWSAAYEARIRSYREYGTFRLTDPIVPSLLCACEICFLPPSRQP